MLKQKPRKKNPNELTVGGHLRELKVRLISVLLLFLSAFVLCYFTSGDILNYLLQIGKSAGYKFVYLAPQEVLVQQLRIAGMLAAVFVSPVFILQTVLFISPALDVKHLLLKLSILMIIGYTLFLFGGCFAYKVLIPFVYTFLYQIGMASNITASISVENYLTLFLTITGCLGIAFETPLCCVSLVRVGVLNTAILRNIRPFIVIAIFVFAALITPPDVFSQCLVAVPLLVLYQISIMLCGFIQKKY